MPRSLASAPVMKTLTAKATNGKRTPLMMTFTALVMLGEQCPKWPFTTLSSGAVHPLKCRSKATTSVPLVSVSY